MGLIMMSDHLLARLTDPPPRSDVLKSCFVLPADQLVLFSPEEATVATLLTLHLLRQVPPVPHSSPAQDPPHSSLQAVRVRTLGNTLLSATPTVSAKEPNDDLALVRSADYCALLYTSLEVIQTSKDGQDGLQHKGAVNSQHALPRAAPLTLKNPTDQSLCTPEWHRNDLLQLLGPTEGGFLSRVRERQPFFTFMASLQFKFGGTS